MGKKGVKGLDDSLIRRLLSAVMDGFDPGAAIIALRIKIQNN